MDISVLTFAPQLSQKILNAQDALFRSLRNLSLGYEAFFCYQKSNKQSKDLCNELKRRYGRLNIMTHSRALGFDGCLLEMLKKSQGKIVLYIDVDRLCRFDALPVFLAKRTEADVVYSSPYASQELKRADAWTRYFSFFCQNILKLPFCETSPSAMMINRRVLDKILPDIKAQKIFLEIFLLVNKQGASFQEAPVLFSIRRNSKLNDLLDAFAVKTRC